MSGSVLLAAGCASGACALAVRPTSARRRLEVVTGARTASAVAGRPRRLVVLGMVGSMVLWLSAGIAPTMVTLLIVGIGVSVSARTQARRRERATRIAIGELCRAIGTELRAGRTANAAFRASVEVAPEPLRALLQPTIDVALRGDANDLADAVAAAVAAGSVAAFDGLNRLVACWRVAASSGAMLAPAIDRIADALQDEIELDRALATALAAPRATVRLLAFLPILGLLLGAAVGANPLRFLLGSPGGLVCLVAAAVFDVGGVVWARHIARRAAGDR